MEENKPRFDRIIAYLRKSRADSDTDTVEEVLAKHEKTMQEYMIKNYSAELPDKCIYREIMSGETIAARPVVREIIRMIQDGKVDAVFVVDLQRLSRGDLSDAGEFSRLFRYSGCKIITPGRIYDISDEYDRKFFESELMRANDYLEYTKKIMLRGRVQSTKAGNYIGSVAPYGYDKCFVDKRSTLKPNPAEADIVKLIFDLYTSDLQYGPMRIANKLNDMGFKTRKNEKWSSNTIKGIVTNPIYIGNVVWDRRKEKITYQDGKIIKQRPRNTDYICVKGIHEALITPEVFEKAQQINKSRSHPATRADRNTTINPLVGLLYCRCGYAMTYKKLYSKTETFLPPVYICSHSTACDCRGAYIDRVYDELYNAMSVAFAQLDVNINSADDNDRKSPDAVLREAYEKGINEIKKQQSRLYDFLERGIYSEEVFLERSTILRERHEKITKELAAVESAVKTSETKREFATSLKKCMESLKDDNISAAEKNTLLKKVIKRIEYSRDKSPKRKYDDTPITLKVYYTL